MKTVVVGMSGGVDSTVSALLLKEQGYRVLGMFMKNWDEKDAQGVCTSVQDYEDVVAVCEQIDIPFYPVNFVQEYWDNVFTQFIAELKQGYTPNPDILCNREIKFKAMLDKSLALGADYLATGHYCRTAIADGAVQLLKGADPSKDQSYFLYAVQAGALNQVLFPVGGMLKSQVREVARRYGLKTAEKKDSTGVCFIGERNFKEFLKDYIAIHPGNFETLSGKVIGRHQGMAYYTLGQRRGLNIGGPGDAWFVVGKDLSRNVVYVEQGDHHPALFCDVLTATEVTWISGCSPSDFPKKPLVCRSKIRYRQPDQACTVEALENGEIKVSFAVPQRAVTPRQSIVFYQGDVCLGGAIIQAGGPSYHQQGLELPPIVSP